MHMVVEALVHMQWSWCKAFCANSTFAHPCTLLQVGSDFCTGSGAGDKIHCQGRLHTCEWSVQTGVAPVLLLPCPLFALLQSSFTAEAAPSKIQMCQMWNSWQLTKIKLWAQSRLRSVNQSLFGVHFLMHRLAFGDNCKWSKDGIFYDSQLILEPLSEIDCHQPRCNVQYKALSLVRALHWSHNLVHCSAPRWDWGTNWAILQFSSRPFANSLGCCWLSDIVLNMYIIGYGI